MHRLLWRVWLRRWFRKARDSIIGSAHQLWDKIQVWALALAYGVVMLVLFFYLAFHLLSVTPRRDIDLQMEELQPKAPCTKK